MGITKEQYTYLLNPIKSSRISHRKQGNKELSYMEAWDIKAHLTRIFGFGNWDAEMLEYRHVTDRAYSRENKDMVECIYSARLRLTVRDPDGNYLCQHIEAAVGSASGPVSSLGDLHDNALKTAASDALKRCAINLGTQFGLSLYDDGRRTDVIGTTLVVPDGYEPPKQETTAEQEARLKEQLGAQQISEEPNPVSQEEGA